MDFPKGNIFGRIPVTPQRLIRELRQMPFRSGRNGWARETQSLFNFLRKKCGGSPEHFFYRCQGSKRREFQIDYLWFREGSPRACLAMEAEWNARKIENLEHDFEKLLYFKSALKLMIANECGTLKARDIAAGLSKYVEEIPTARGEVVLLFVFCKRGDRKAYCHVGNGTSPFQFKELTSRGVKASLGKRLNGSSSAWGK